MTWRNAGKWREWHYRLGETERSHDRPAPQRPKIGSMFAQVAIKNYARTGQWAPWFLWVVGDEVPEEYVEAAGRLGSGLPTPT